MRYKIIILFVSLLSTGLMAQDNESIPRRPFQFTFLFPPFSTSGTDVGNYKYGISFNPFIGYTGGIEGVELGGFININRYNMRGIQGSGFLNITGVDNGQDIRHNAGIQYAGFGNVVNGDFIGLQIAGFGNFVSGTSTGIAWAGFMNAAGSSDLGVQLAGFGNFIPTGMSFVQSAGFMNVGETIYGVQSAGFLNVAREIRGVQAAGFGNIATEGTSIVQCSGFINVADEVLGIQTAGFINVANYVKGVQVAGFINICDSIDGIPLSFINIVKKNGYRHFAISANDYAPLRLSYRLGVSHFYNTYTISKLTGDSHRWAFGIGLGSMQPISERLSVDVELSAHQEWWLGDNRAPWASYVDRLNMVNTCKFGFNVNVMDHLSFYAGPTLNLRISNHHGVDDVLGNDIRPYWAEEKDTYSDYGTRYGFWPGIEVGVVF